MRRGFTIVELLVVIAVIALFVAIAIPAISRARLTVRRSNEMQAARQLMVAWSSYATANRDQVIPGYKSGLNAWTKDKRLISEITVPVAMARYPWRLAPYLDWNLRGLYVNNVEELLERIEYTAENNYAYVASVSPALGINATWVGGDENELGFDAAQAQIYGRFYVSRASEVIHPARLMVFCSARGIDPQSFSGTVEGYFRVRSPWLSKAQGERWSEQWRASADPAEHGQVSLRYSGSAVCAFVDAHVEPLTEPSLRDMRHWSNRARARSDALSPVLP